MDDRPVARRRFLVCVGAAAGALVAACTGDDSSRRRKAIPSSSTESTPGSTPASTPPASPSVDADSTLAAAVRRDADRLAADYRAVLQRHPPLRGALGVLLEHHETHLEVMGAAAGGGTFRPAPAGSARRAVAYLRRREQLAVAARRRDALAAVSGELARALAAMAASSAQHVVVLDALTPGSRRAA